jgi:alanine dehydrogenase
VLEGRVPSRTGPEEITLYKSLGIAAQDMICAAALYKRALAEGFGTSVEF